MPPADPTMPARTPAPSSRTTSTIKSTHHFAPVQHLIQRGEADVDLRLVAWLPSLVTC